ncbi:MAG: hypothetical protein VW146_00385 [Gammaproteobacteria bacterium]
MAKIIKLQISDPILSEFNNSIDKDAALKTIAFKFFNTNVIQAASYLGVGHSEKNIFSTDLSTNSHIIDSIDYYQPELFSENRCS